MITFLPCLKWTDLSGSNTKGTVLGVELVFLLLFLIRADFEIFLSVDLPYRLRKKP